LQRGEHRHQPEDGCRDDEQRQPESTTHEASLASDPPAPRPPGPPGPRLLRP
jgi:hypothetical protein